MNLVGAAYLTRYEPTQQPPDRLHSDRHRRQSRIRPRHRRRPCGSRGTRRRRRPRRCRTRHVARRTRRLHRGHRGCRRPRNRPPPHRRVPAAHGGALRRGGAADEPTAGADVGVLQPELECRRSAGIPLDPPRAAAPVGSRQHRDRGLQRRGDQRLAAQWWLRGGQGHRQIHHRLRRARVGTGRAWHRVRLGAARIDAVDRTRREGGRGLRRAARRRRRHVRSVHAARPHRGAGRKVRVGDRHRRAARTTAHTRSPPRACRRWAEQDANVGMQGTRTWATT